ncbi:MAG TPA: hypothetical protein VF544_24080 [Pyrinomonadaceae bacterium]
MLATCAQAQTAGHRHRVLIDRSGSMEGFFTTGKINDLQNLLHDLSGLSGDAYYFIDKELVPVGQEAGSYGNNTYLREALDRSLAQQPAPAILWLVTDNQSSVGNQTESDHDIAQFYDRLRSDTIKRLYFFPLKLDFKGKLYRDDGHALLTPGYEGKRGLLVYALLLDERAHDEFERVTTEFQSRYRSAAGDMRRILIKPLEQDTVTAKLIPGEKFRIENENQLVAGEFAEGAPITGNFKVELTSQLGQMKISRADIDVRVPEKFRTGDFTESEIKPDFTPRDLQDFEPQNKRNVVVTIKTPGVHIRNNLLSWWNCITHNRGDINGRIQIMIRVPGQNFDVVSNLANEFSTTRDIYSDAGESVQSRIYKLDDLVKKMMPERQVDIRPRIGNSADGMIPVRLVVRYPKWPAVVLIAAILTLLLLLFLLSRLFGHQQLYRLTWNSGQYRACPDFRLWPFIGQRVELDNRTAAMIKKSLSGIRVRAVGGYTVDDTKSRLVNPGGTDFNVSQSSDGAGINFYFSSTTAALTGNSGSGNNEDGILGGVSYGSQGGEGGERRGVASAPPPIRKPTTGRHSEGGGGDSTGSSGEAAEDNSPVNLDDLFP